MFCKVKQMHFYPLYQPCKKKAGENAHSHSFQGEMKVKKALLGSC